MANCCFYDMEVIGNKVDIERLISIMKYEDSEYYLYRIREVEVADIEEWKNGLHVAHIFGEVAWSSEPWIECESFGTIDEDGRIFTSMMTITKELNLAVEWFTEECGNCFAEHFAVCKGKITARDYAYLSEPSYEVGDKEDYRDGTKEEILEEITESHRDELGDDFDEFIEQVKGALDRTGYVYIRIGGYDPVFDLDALWDGKDVHKESTPFYVED